jgi:mono/diheme cytochrome c family protein
MKRLRFSSYLLAILVLSSPSTFAQNGDATRGKALFATKNCLQCHAVEVQSPAKPGPSLVGAAQKRDKAWLIRVIKDPNQMKNDPIVKELKHKYPVGMPASGLDDAQVIDVIAYLETLGNKDSKK